MDLNRKIFEIPEIKGIGIGYLIHFIMNLFLAYMLFLGATVYMQYFQDELLDPSTGEILYLLFISSYQGLLLNLLIFGSLLLGCWFLLRKNFSKVTIKAALFFVMVHGLVGLLLILENFGDNFPTYMLLIQGCIIFSFSKYAYKKIKGT